MSITSQLLDIFEGYRMTPGLNDQYEQTGKAILTSKIEAFVSGGNPIRFSMLGYPFKSSNTRDKVIGNTPDLGERVSLENFGRFSLECQQVYGPGCQFSIISDGYAFADIWGKSDKEVAQYTEIVRDMSKDLPISWFDMFSFYPATLSPQAIRERLMSDFGITSSELERRILFEQDVNYLYRGMIRFMKEEYAIRDFSTNTQRQKAAKISAREMMFRNEAYSALVRRNFADHIRLSMHQSINNGAKYSFQLIPSPRAMHSPWHSALVLHREGPVETMHRKDAEQAGYELVYENGKPSHFQEL